MSGLDDRIYKGTRQIEQIGLEYLSEISTVSFGEDKYI